MLTARWEFRVAGTGMNRYSGSDKPDIARVDGFNCDGRSVIYGQQKFIPWPAARGRARIVIYRLASSAWSASWTGIYDFCVMA
jgi:hypothetical protein